MEAYAETIRLPRKRTRVSVLSLSKDKDERQRNSILFPFIEAIRPAKRSHRPRAHDVVPTAIHRLASRFDCACNSQPCYSCRRLFNCCCCSHRTTFDVCLETRSHLELIRRRFEIEPRRRRQSAGARTLEVSRAHEKSHCNYDA